MTTSAPQQPNKPGFTLALVACGMGVLGIITPLIGLLFVLVTIVLALIATLKGLKAKYWPTVGFSGLAWALVIAGFATSPIFLGAVFGNEIVSDMQDKLNESKATSAMPSMSDPMAANPVPETAAPYGNTAAEPAITDSAVVPVAPAAMPAPEVAPVEAIAPAAPVAAPAPMVVPSIPSAPSGSINPYAAPAPIAPTAPTNP